MTKTVKTINIKAPVEKVFDYISEPTNLPEIWPSLVEVKDVQKLPSGGTRNRWVYKMAGILLKGTGEDTEYVPNQRLVSKTKGGVESTQTWMFQPEAGGTKVTFEVEYTVPIPVLGKLAEAIIVKMNEHEGELILANLKARMEM
ncbi:MAG: SRPBCC family protein [Patescibacteria group bacterium]